MDHRTILCSYCNKPLRVKGDNSEKVVKCPTCKKDTTVPLVSTEVEELDFYALNKPFSFISILKEKETLKKRYVVLEPFLSDEDKEILSFLKETIIKTLDVRLDELGEDAESYLENAVEDILRKYEIVVDGVAWEKLLYYLKKKFLGYDDIDPLMKDPFIEDISCDGSEVSLFIYQRQFGSLETNIVFFDDDSLAKFVIKLAQKCGKHISVSDPMLDATMPDGSRIQMTLRGEITTRGSTFTIRKFRANPITPVDLIDYDTFSIKMIAYLWMAVEHGFNALISGGTASGKTSALNALALFIPRESKIVSIEETREINLPHPNWIPGVTRSGFGEVVNDRMVGEIDLFDLMKAALRQRPEYILVGEIRGKEAYVLFQAMATGHTTYSTVHADSTQALIHRLEGKPINIPRTMLQSLDIVLLMRNQKTQDKQQRRCIKVVELLNVDNETNEVLTNTVFEWDPQQDEFLYTGKSFILEQVRSQLDMNTQEMTKELRQRAEILQWMNTYHIREFTDVSNILAKYTETPEKVLHLITKEPEKIEDEIKESLFSTESKYESLLEIPDVITHNKRAAEIKKTKREKNSLLVSLFSKKENEKKSIQTQHHQSQKSTKSEPIEKKSTKKEKIHSKHKSAPELNQRIPYATKNPASYFSQTRETLETQQKEKNLPGYQPGTEEEKEIEFFYDNTKIEIEKEKNDKNKNQNETPRKVENVEKEIAQDKEDKDTDQNKKLRTVENVQNEEKEIAQKKIGKDRDQNKKLRNVEDVEKEIDQKLKNKSTDQSKTLLKKKLFQNKKISDHTSKKAITPSSKTIDNSIYTKRKKGIKSIFEKIKKLRIRINKEKLKSTFKKLKK